jgi:hypothetical protein
MQGRSVPRLTWSVLAIAAWAGAAAAEPLSRIQADGSLMLAVEERVTVRLGDDGGLTWVSAEPAPDGAAAPPKPRATGAGPRDGNPLVSTPPGTVSFVASQVGDNVLLKVENGGSQAFDYQAWLPRGAGLEPSNVCTVLPLLAGYEQWPGRRMPWIVFNRFAPHATNGVSCPQPSGPPPAVPAP